MTCIRLLAVTALLSTLYGCSGGGGGGTPSATPLPWQRFRHDLNNSGAGGGDVSGRSPALKWKVPVDAALAPDSTSCISNPSHAISSSPVVNENGTIYAASEGGTLAAFNPDGSVKWRAISCGTQALGPMVSSPTVYITPTVNVINVYVASTTGHLYAFVDNGSGASCAAVFTPSLATGATARFISSPGITASGFSGNVNGIFLGAEIDQQGEPATGKMYAVNSDGSQRWEYPRPGDSEVFGPVTSSPAFDVNGAIYFTAVDDSNAESLYALVGEGRLKWKIPLTQVRSAGLPLAPSPLVGTFVYAATSDGKLISVNSDGSFRWEVPAGHAFVASPSFGLAFSSIPPALCTATPVPPTPVPTDSPTPVGSATLPGGDTPTPTLTPTQTPTPTVQHDTLFAVTREGILVGYDATTGDPFPFAGPVAAFTDPVISSPALSTDALLVFGTADGLLHAIDSFTGSEAWGCALPLTPCPINSSPAIAGDGTIYVGADDGFLYAVGR